MRVDFPSRARPCAKAATAAAAVRHARRTPGERLEQAMLALSSGHGTVTIHSEMPWASITFAGTRHTMTLCYTGAGPVDAGEIMLARLPDHEFAIPGQLVADASIRKVEHEMLPEPKLRVQVEVLLLEE